MRVEAGGSKRRIALSPNRAEFIELGAAATPPAAYLEVRIAETG
jgi:hypothetical protein